LRKNLLLSRGARPNDKPNVTLGLLGLLRRPTLRETAGSPVDDEYFCNLMWLTRSASSMHRWHPAPEPNRLPPE